MTRPQPHTAAGIDGCRNGWVMALITHDANGPSEVAFEPDVATLLDRCRKQFVAAVGVDIPIGFAADGNRTAERLARGRLGRRAATLFTTPAHPVLAIDDWTGALTVNRQLTGKGFSKQAFHLLKRSREVRDCLRPSEQPWCSEVHPDSSFTAMNDGEPLPTKQGEEGMSLRWALVTRLVAGDAEQAIERSDAPVVDALDAYAAAWSANRLALGVADVLGHGVDPDGYSLTIVI